MMQNISIQSNKLVGILMARWRIDTAAPSFQQQSLHLCWRTYSCLSPFFVIPMQLTIDVSEKFSSHSAMAEHLKNTHTLIHRGVWQFKQQYPLVL